MLANTSKSKVILIFTATSGDRAGSSYRRETTFLRVYFQLVCSKHEECVRRFVVRASDNDLGPSARPPHNRLDAGR